MVGSKLRTLVIETTAFGKQSRNANNFTPSFADIQNQYQLPSFCKML
jgi:hypothetical protein